MDHDASPPWAELPAEVLSEIARHLHDAADFLRFHAVCGPWREASSSAPAVPTAALHPWLVAPCPCGLYSHGMHFHWPFSSKGKGVYLPHRSAALRGTMFDSADAATGRVLTAGFFDNVRTASLVNPLTGDATPLPLLPYYSAAYIPRLSRAVFCSNGTVLLGVTAGQLLAAVLQPGEARWEKVDVASPVELGSRDVLSLDVHDRRAAALCSSGFFAGGNRAVAKLPPKPEGDRYVLDYRGELLCVDVLDIDPPATISASVYALEVGGDGRTPRWAARERGRGMERLCLFLGWESSFAADAEEFAGAEVAGGCAYFVARHPRWTASREVHAVWRYGFEDGTATVVDVLPSMFNRMSMWYTPRPRISPVSSLREPALRNAADEGHFRRVWGLDLFYMEHLRESFLKSTL